MEINWNHYGSNLELALRQNIRKFEFWNSFGNSLYNSFKRTWNYQGNILEIVSKV